MAAPFTKALGHRHADQHRSAPPAGAVWGSPQHVTVTRHTGSRQRAHLVRCAALAVQRPCPALAHLRARVRARPQHHATLTFARLCRHLGSSEGLPQQRLRPSNIANLAAKAARAERSRDGVGAACTQLLNALRSLSRAQINESRSAEKAARSTCACSRCSNCSATSRLSSMHKRSATRRVAVTVAGCVAPHT